MRKLLFSVFIFSLLCVPVKAEPARDTTLGIILGPVQLFVVNNATPLTFTFDQYSDFGVVQDLGDVNYDLISNVGWVVRAKILDTTGGGQTADDWNDASWTLSVNGAALNESTTVVIDTDTNPVNRSGALWEVLLTIPWSEGPSTPDCQIELTAETL
jgi:hypothetical protein